MSSPLASRLKDAQHALTIAWDTQSHADIDIAITKWASILRSIQEDEDKCDDILSSYASALLLRWRRRHRAEDIDNAISTLEKSVHIQGDAVTLARYENYCNLGAAHLDRWEALKRGPADLLMAAESWELARSIAIRIGRTQESTRVILPNLGDVYCTAYSHKFSDISVISRAIERYSSALPVATPEASTKLRYKLGKAYAALFLETSEDVNLRLGHFYLEESIASDLSNEDKEDASMDLSNIYLHEYEQKKTRDSLDSAVYWARRAVHIQDEEGNPRILRKVASLLTLLYKDLGDVIALDQAILCHEHAWDLPGSHENEDSATFYYNYGTALMRRSLISHNPRQSGKSDVKKSVELLQLAVDNAESEDSSAYEAQLKTAQERYNNIDKYPPVRPYRHEDGRFTIPPPIRSATVPSITSYQPPATPETAEQVPKSLASQPSFDAGLDSSPSYTSLTRPDEQVANANDLFKENLRGWLPIARHKTLQYPAQVSSDSSWDSAQSNVEVWAGHRVVGEYKFSALALHALSCIHAVEPMQGQDHLQLVFPTQYLNPSMPDTRSEPSNSETPNRSASLVGAKKAIPPSSPRKPFTYPTPLSGADQVFLSPSQIPSPPIRFPSTSGDHPPTSIPPSPQRSPRARFATISGTDLSSPIFPHQVRLNSSPHTNAAILPTFGITGRGVSSYDSKQFESDVLDQSNIPSAPQTLSPPNQPILLPPRASRPTEVPLANVEVSSTTSSSQEAASGSDFIRPTNLTGRIVKTDRFPVDEGGFSSIYKGAFGATKVAIKVIRNLTAVDSATLRKRLRREMDVWWKLEHPNVVPLWGYIDDMGPLPSMISPWYENGNASNYVQKEGLGLEFRLQLLREVSAGLRYLHDFSPPVVHGDLKPGNVLIDNDGVARLCDFGLAHLVVSDAETSITSAGVGTIRYAAPELRCPEDDDECVRASTETDIYSLACIAYEFLYQKLPFADKGSIQTIIAAGYSHIPPARMETEDPSVLGPTAPHYWELFQSCWDEKPNERPNIISFCEHIDLAFLAFAN